ncbi:MAG TPA: AAA family ATPase [Vicinamibacterales bacterium]|nr:AAA family ATPase [Vicinamibacterales bacterium]
MAISPVVYFASYRLDARSQVLWDDDRPVRLTPKAFGVLDYLVRHPERIVTKHELLDHVWPEVHVGDAVLKVAIREIRQALGDDPDAPRFVQTARRIGYRFVAPVSVIETRTPATSAPAARTLLVGREQPLATLTASLSRAIGGQRQTVFVVGEGGIGKTSVIDAFVSRVEERDANVWVARGQCLEHVGGAEAYLPVLDALGRLARLPGRERVVTLLRRYAPTWLAQMPALVERRETLQHEIFGATPERMLREIAEALEALTAETPLVIVLDDLHWSDDATLDFVGMMARRSGPGRLLIVAAYRPVEVALSRPALKTMKQELIAKGLCEELRLDFLTLTHTATLLDTRFPGHTLPSALTSLIHQRTSGNPLFIGNFLEYLAGQEMVGLRAGRWELIAPLETVATASPETLRQVIEAQLARLSTDERAVLEAASACGLDFSAVAVAAGLAVVDERAETYLDGLARRGQFVTSLELAELPERRWSPRYQFVHSLHQETLYRSLPPGRRLRFHLRIAERLEQIYGERSADIASELAEHFEQARDDRRAISYLRSAAKNETRRFANREAAGWLDRALELSDNLPPHERAITRGDVLGDLGRVRRNMGDMHGSSDAFMEAARIAGERGDTSAMVEVLLVGASATTWFDGAACLAAADEAERVANTISPTLARYTRGYAAYWYLLWSRWNPDWARDCERALVLAQETDDRLRLFAMLPRCAYVRLAQSLYEAAVDTADEGARRALAVDDAFTCMVCQFYRIWAGLLAGEWGTTDRVLTESLELAERNGHRLWHTLYAGLRAWLLRETGAHAAALALAREAVDAARGVGVPLADLLTQTQLGLAIVESSRTGGPHISEAIEILERIVARLDREPMLMGFAWRMPVLIGLSSAYRGSGAWTKAEAAAQEACELAATSGERTWLALAWMARAERALAEGEIDRADSALDRAVTAADAADAPLAAWRVHACAARTAAARDRSERALDHQSCAASVIARLAASLGTSNHHRQTFLDSDDVRAALTLPR